MNSYQDTPTPSINSLTKYIRIRSEEDSKFVMFDFAIGDPALFVELVLPPDSFKEFCTINKVIHMSPEQMAANDNDEDKWRYGVEPTLVRDNHTNVSLSAQADKESL